MGPPKENLEKKNIFAEKYDEIRRLDGICFVVMCGTGAIIGCFDASIGNSPTDTGKT
jgi:hypothetical protein